MYAYTHTPVSIFVELSAELFSKCNLKFILFKTVISSCCEISYKLLYAPTFFFFFILHRVNFYATVHIYASLVNISITRKCIFSDKKLPSFILLTKRHALVNVHINVKGSSNEYSFSSLGFKLDRFLDIFILIFVLLDFILYSSLLLIFLRNIADITIF